MYALVDCNNFYCSCEKLFKPKLEGRPMIVLSNNDGCAIARSEEAKALGISMGTPSFLMEQLIREKGVEVFSSNYTLYGDMSDRVMKTLAGFVPEIEIYSIDEAFLNMYDLKHQNLAELGTEIRKTISKNLGLPVTVGIAPSKALAKMANRYAKKNRPDTGLFCAANEEHLDEMMHFTEVNDIWGIGHQYALFLRRHGFRTAFDLRRAPKEWVRKHLTVMGERLVSELNGIATFAWEVETRAKKNITNARSFGSLLTRKQDIQEALCNYAANVALKLRQQKSCPTRLQVFVQTNPHKRDHSQYMRSVIVPLERPSNTTGDILKHCLRGFEIIFKEGYRYMKCGLNAMDLIPEDKALGSLFHPEPNTKNKKLLNAMDSVNLSFGRDTLRMAAQGYEKRYRMRADRLSPSYTTDIKQLLKVKI